MQFNHQEPNDDEFNYLQQQTEGGDEDLYMDSRVVKTVRNLKRMRYSFSS